MSLTRQALSFFSQDIARTPDMAGLTSFFAGLDDDQLVELADCLMDCVDQLAPRDCTLLVLLLLRETTTRALSVKSGE